MLESRITLSSGSAAINSLFEYKPEKDLCSIEIFSAKPHAYGVTGSSIFAGDICITCSFDGFLRIYSVGRNLQLLQLIELPFISNSIHLNDIWLYIGSKTGVLYTFKLDNGLYQLYSKVLCGVLPAEIIYSSKTLLVLSDTPFLMENAQIEPIIFPNVLLSLTIRLNSLFLLTLKDLSSFLWQAPLFQKFHYPKQSLV
jgi:hypothetical protein